MRIRDAATSSFGQEIGKLVEGHFLFQQHQLFFFVGSQSDAVVVNNCFLELNFDVDKIDESFER